jgi:hypothetical protein
MVVQALITAVDADSNLVDGLDLENFSITEVGPAIERFTERQKIKGTDATCIKVSLMLPADSHE